MRARTLADHCRACGTPLAGILGKVMRFFGKRRGEKHDDLCNSCERKFDKGKLAELTVFFADLVGFTSMTNEVGAEESFNIVNAFFKSGQDAFARNGAHIDKYIGDAMMVLFNVPKRCDDFARKALASALELQRGMPKLSENIGRELKARVGMATGYARVGHVGSRLRKDYTVIGEVVNLASRLEAAAAPGEIVMDNNTYEKVGEETPEIPEELVSLKGFKAQVGARRVKVEKVPL